MILGVTGSRNKPRFQVSERFFQFIRAHQVLELHHGDCVGWDECCYKICAYYKIKTIAHPPDNDALRAFTSSDVIAPPKSYLERNKDIVNAVDYLIAAPDGPERLRSGTWSTVRYAKRQGVRGVVWL